MSFRIILPNSVRKQIQSLPVTAQDRVIDSITGLSIDPHPPGSKNLHSRAGWRIRVGEYRILYDIENDIRVVTIIQVGPRGGIYR